MGCYCTVHRLCSSFFIVFSRLCKLQMVIDKVIYDTSDILCIDQIALLKAVFLFFRQRLCQKIPLLFPIVYPCIDECFKSLPTRRVTLKVVSRNPIALLPIFRRTNKHFVCITVIKRDAVRNNVVNINISRFKQPRYIKILTGIQANTILILKQLELDYILSCRFSAFYLLDLLSEFFIFLCICFLLFRNLRSHIIWFSHFTCKLYPHDLRRAIFPHNRVDNTNGLGYRTANDRIVNQLNVKQTEFVFLGYRAFVLSVNFLARFCICHAFFQIWNQFPQRLCRKMCCFGGR